MTSVSVCNDDCICMNCDCLYYHPLDFAERKVVYKLYNALNNPSKKEDNPEKRKKNCNFGKLCNRADCGFRHRLVFNDRLKLIDGYKNHQLKNIKEVQEKPRKEVKEFSIKTSNPFDLLPDVEVSLEISAEVPVVFIRESNMDFRVALLEGKKEVITVEPKKEVPIERVVPNSWADMCDSDDEFLMKF